MKNKMIVLIILILSLFIIGMLTAVADATNPTVAFTAAESIVPFAKLNTWRLSPQQIADITNGEIKRNLLGDREKYIPVTIDIEGLGNNLLISYHFKNDKLNTVEMILEDTPSSDPNQNLNQTAIGTALIKYYNSFKLMDKDPDSSVYTFKDKSNYIVVSSYTSVSFGYIRNKDHISLGMKFYAPVIIDLELLKQAKGYQGWAISDKDSQYLLMNPYMFEHELTRKREPFTYSWFVPMFQVQNTTKSSRLPQFGIYFYYRGVKELGACKSIQFSIDGTVYRLSSIQSTSSTKTQLGEYSSEYLLLIGPNNMKCLEEMIKTKKSINFILEGKKNTLIFTLPNQSKLEIINAYQLFKKLGGMNDIFMDFMFYRDGSMSIL